MPPATALCRALRNSYGSLRRHSPIVTSVYLTRTLSTTNACIRQAYPATSSPRDSGRTNGPALSQFDSAAEELSEGDVGTTDAWRSQHPHEPLSIPIHQAREDRTSRLQLRAWTEEDSLERPTDQRALRSIAVDDINGQDIEDFPRVDEQAQDDDDDLGALELELSPPSTQSRPPLPTRGASITEAERVAFAKLFSLASTSDAGDSQTQSTTTPPSAKESSEVKAVTQERAAKLDDGLSEILDKAATSKGSRVARKATSAPGGQSAHPFTEKFPSSLRAMAEVAGNIIYERQQLKPVQEEISSAQRDCAESSKSLSLKKLQTQEATRIERLITEAATDWDIWQVLEKQLFSPIEKLDLDAQNSLLSKEVEVKAVDESEHKRVEEAGDKQRAKAKEIEGGKEDGKRKRKRKGQGKDEETERAGEMETEKTVNIQDLAVIGPNYPSCLLFAMRQLRHHFPASQLLFAILPKVKSLGRGSYTLGASASLYNELISVTWELYGDGAFVVDILADMDSSAIEYDSETYDVVSSILDHEMRAFRGELGVSIQALAALEKAKKTRRSLGFWKRKIAQRLQEVALQLAKEKRVMEEDERIRLEVERHLDYD